MQPSWALDAKSAAQAIHHRAWPFRVTQLKGEPWFPFEKKQKYLVYVVTEPNDIQTGICTGTKKITEAEQEMKQLDKLLERCSLRSK